MESQSSGLEASAILPAQQDSGSALVSVVGEWRRIEEPSETALEIEFGGPGLQLVVTIVVDELVMELEARLEKAGASLRREPDGTAV